MLHRAVPQSVSQNIARAKSLLKRDEPLRALECLIAALENYDPSHLLGKTRFEVEVMFIECVQELNRQPQIRQFIQKIAQSPKAEISYTPRSEAKLLAVLPLIRKGLLEAHEATEQAKQDEHTQRKAMLQEKGMAYLEAGDLARGKAAFRRLGEEFGSEPGVLVQIGEALLKADLLFDAVEFLELAIDDFPKESQAYALATSAYISLREYEKAEAIYTKAMRQFGKHPRTLLNLAKLYVLWNKKEQAYEAAAAAVAVDPSLEEAQELVRQLA